MSRLLIVSPVSDVAGVGIGIKQAFDEVRGDWEARHVRGGPEWLDYPFDAEWDQLEELWDWADAVLVMELPKHVWHLPRKPTVVYHTGSRYRRDPKRRSLEAERIESMEVSGSLDLCRLRRTRWLPITTDVEGIRNTFPRIPHDGPIRVAHAPTNRELKSTDLILEVLDTVPGIEVDVIEGVPWAECLARKSRADIYIDELTLGYGMNALECWAMGIPVVSGIYDRAFRSDALRMWGEFPFVDATPDTLRTVVTGLVASPELRDEAATDGWRFVKNYHSRAAVVQRVTDLLTRLRAVWMREHRTLTSRMTA